MVEYKDLIDWIGGDHESVEEVAGLLLDVINGLYPVEQLKQEILDYKEHEK